ncbi:hypothetical protein TREES_T100013022 [Tupaia chinensis]|uniref:Uncharacterized protein n=1 Tax=Tupaia chinensis TaxID=246437 RepID=L9L512_TUPCH|nr:hypothetical protein TREES_T100013022 [Tupaia chinensis]
MLVRQKGSDTIPCGDSGTISGMPDSLTGAQERPAKSSVRPSFTGPPWSWQSCCKELWVTTEGKELLYALFLHSLEKTRLHRPCWRHHPVPFPDPRDSPFISLTWGGSPFSCQPSNSECGIKVSSPDTDKIMRRRPWSRRKLGAQERQVPAWHLQWTSAFAMVFLQPQGYRPSCRKQEPMLVRQKGSDTIPCGDSGTISGMPDSLTGAQERPAKASVRPSFTGPPWSWQSCCKELWVTTEGKEFRNTKPVRKSPPA